MWMMTVCLDVEKDVFLFLSKMFWVCGLIDLRNGDWVSFFFFINMNIHVILYILK